MKGLGEILNQHGLPHHFAGCPAMFGILMAEEEVSDYRGWAKSDRALYDRLMLAFMGRGVIPDPDSCEPWFLSYAHDDAVIDATLQVAEDAVASIL